MSGNASIGKSLQVLVLVRRWGREVLFVHFIDESVCPETGTYGFASGGNIAVRVAGDSKRGTCFAGGKRGPSDVDGWREVTTGLAVIGHCGENCGWGESD